MVMENGKVIIFILEVFSLLYFFFFFLLIFTSLTAKTHKSELQNVWTPMCAYNSMVILISCLF